MCHASTQMPATYRLAIWTQGRVAALANHWHFSLKVRHLRPPCASHNLQHSRSRLPSQCLDYGILIILYHKCTETFLHETSWYLVRKRGAVPIACSFPSGCVAKINMPWPWPWPWPMLICSCSCPSACGNDISCTNMMARYFKQSQSQLQSDQGACWGSVNMHVCISSYLHYPFE